MIDAHNHLGRWLTGTWSVPDVGELVALMDELGIESIVNLDGMWGDELDANLDRYDRAHPGRFATFAQWDRALVRARRMERARRADAPTRSTAARAV